MAEEIVSILKVGTDEAVKSVGDLRENIKQLKKVLNETQVDSAEGWAAYQNTLDELKVNQNALKDAMYATTGTFQDVVNSATGASKSYNALVHTMAALKEEWRATNDEARRNELGVQIANVNQQLKDMDASVGNFQRNVGNYSSALDGLRDGFLATAGGAGAVINPVKNVTMGFKALSATPVVGILGLLANIIMRVVDNLDTTEKSSNRLKVALAPLQAGATLVTKAFQFLGDKLADVAEWVTKVMDKFGLINESMREHQDITKEEIALVEDRRKVEMANADAALEVAQLRAKAAEKDKYTAAERLKFIEDASQKEREISDRNVEIARREYDVLKRRADLAENSVEENDALADAYVRLQNEETNYFNKVRELNAQRVEAINQIKAETKANKDLVESKKEVIMADEYDGFAEDDPWAEYEAQEAERDAYWQGLIDKLQMQEDYKNSLIEAKMEESEILAEIEEKNTEKAKEEMMKRIEVVSSVADSTSSILSSIADMYENDEKSAEKNAKKIKALRIASATIDMLNGAVTAFTSAMQLGPVAGPIVGAANAAAVIAMGVANISKIKSTSFSGNGSSSSSAAPVVSAPSIDTGMNSVRVMTSASEEERLNRMAQPQKVYILQSDIEASSRQSKVRVQEAAF